MRLSLLDQSPRGAGQSVGDVLRSSIDRAELAESLGFRRVWFAEHRRHGAFAGGSPLTLTAAALARTSSIRIGSGGVLIAQNDSGQTAEAALALHALHPDRVDLGLGKAAAHRDHFVGVVRNLVHRLGDDRPALWLLGNSTGSTGLADELGAGFAYGHFFNPRDAVTALAARRSGPNLVAVRVVTGSDGDEARDRAYAFSAWRTRRDLGVNEPLPAVGEVPVVPREHQTRLQNNLAAVICGSHREVVSQLRTLSEATDTGELMITLPEPDAASAADQLRGLAAALATAVPQEGDHVLAR